MRIKGGVHASLTVMVALIVVMNFQRKVSRVFGTYEYCLYLVVRMGVPVPEYSWSKLSSVMYSLAMSSCWRRCPMKRLMC